MSAQTQGSVDLIDASPKTQIAGGSYIEMEMDQRNIEVHRELLRVEVWGDAPRENNLTRESRQKVDWITAK